MTSRHYEIDGEAYPRVTSICAIVSNEHLAYWRGRVGNTEADRVSREATDLGKRVHKAVEQYARQRTCGPRCLCGEHPCPAWWTGMGDDIVPHVRAYVAWHIEHVRAVVAVEKLTISRAYKFAGTVDQVAFLDDNTTPTIIDLKSSNNASESWGLQTAGYQIALDEEGIQCGHRMTVQIPSKEPGALYPHEFDDHLRDQRAFLNARKLYAWRETLKPPKPTGPRIRFSAANRRGEQE